MAPIKNRRELERDRVHGACRLAGKKNRCAWCRQQTQLGIWPNQQKKKKKTGKTAQEITWKAWDLWKTKRALESWG